MSDFDPVLLAVLANRVDSVVREMENTLLRTGRSAVLAMARDFSCSLVTGDDRLLSSGEGLPVHVFGSELLTEAMGELHDDVAPGDAFLHNDPYRGNTHAADHTILVPVFWEGEHLFTAVAKAHQADIGNSGASTYMPFARDVYEEGAVVFPCVRIQRDGQDVDDVVRMCRSRIRVPDQWYGDYLAMVGAARIAERRLHELAAEYGTATVKAFIEEWFDYSERRMAHVIGELPAVDFVGEGFHDPLPTLTEHPDGVPLRVAVGIDPAAARISVDLRDNLDCVDAGINQSKATATSNVMTGIFNSLDADIPHNSGSFRRVDVQLRENCLVGIPRFPHSCSVATTNIGERLVVTTQRAFAEAVAGRGVAEGACGIGPGFSVISGGDARRGDESYVNQMFLGSQGGPAGPRTDGWVTYGNAVTNGLMFRDSVEVDEQKYPIRIEELRVRPDSEGAGHRRGAPGTIVRFGPKRGAMEAAYVTDGFVHPPRGARGGGSGAASIPFLLRADGRREPVAPIGAVRLEPGEQLGHELSGGGGYGDPLEREPERVRDDVLAGIVSPQRALDVYGVALTGPHDDDQLAVDQDATDQRRAALRADRPTAGAPA